MTIKNPTATATSSHCSTLSSTVTDFDTSTGVASTGTTVEEGQQVKPSFTHSVSIQEEQLVETEVTSNYYISISAQGHVDVPNGCTVHREGDQTIIRFRWFNAFWFYSRLCLGVVWNGCLALIAVTQEMWWLLVFPLYSGLGLYILYAVACNYLNSTYVTINDYYVDVDHRPLKLFPPTQTMQFTKSGYEEVRVWRDSRRVYINACIHRVEVTYEIHLWDARTESFTRLPCVNSKLDKALFVAQEIQKYLTSKTGAAAASATAEKVEIV